MRIIFFICISILINLSAQTYSFTNTTTTNIATGATTNFTVSVFGVPTSGMVLRQVNISFGNTASLNSANMNLVTMRLIDANATQINLLSPTSFDGAVGDFRLFNIRLRDHSALKTPAQQKAATSSVISKGYPYYYGYYKPEGSFSSLNTTNLVNGNWTFRVVNGSAGTRIFTKIELIFGPPITVYDIRTTDPNQSCATRQCLQTGDVYWASNNGYPVNQASSPPNNVGGTCAWNSQKDNMIWFYFKANASTAEISASGLSTVQESSVFQSVDCLSYTNVTGGCGPSAMFNAGFHAEKYNTNTTGATYTNGYAWNAGYKLSGLVAGQEYIFILDGQAGVNSDFYIELTGGGDVCTVLPIELQSFKANFDIDKIKLEWIINSNNLNKNFILEKSNEIENWKEIAIVNEFITQNKSNYFTFFDLEPSNSINYYRLKQFDLNNKIIYSEVVSIDNSSNSLEFSPNPFNDLLQVNVPENYDNQEVNLIFYNVLGKVVLEKKLTNGNHKLNVKELNEGIYFVKYKNFNGITSQKTLIKL